MFIQRLMIQNFRNLSCVELETVPSFNLICGPNGAGKTSVLEAINYLALGRSFRQASNQYLIQQGQSTLSIFAQIQEDLNAHAVQTTIGMSRTRGDELMIKVNSDPLFRLIDLIDHICVQVIHPQGIELITKESEGRRSFIDWGVYYSDDSFKQLWWDYRKALKQRNALLRQNTVRNKPRLQRYIDSYSLQESALDGGLAEGEGATFANFSQQGSFLSSSRNNQGSLASYGSPDTRGYANHESNESIASSENGDAATPYSLQNNSFLNSSSGSNSSYSNSSSSRNAVPYVPREQESIASSTLPYRGNVQSTYQLQDAFNVQDLSPVLQEHLRLQVHEADEGAEGSGMRQEALHLRESSGGQEQQGALGDRGEAVGAYVQGAGAVTGDTWSQGQGAPWGEQGQATDVEQATRMEQAEFRRGLKQIWSSPLSEFEIWNEQIADLSEKITVRRLNYLEDLNLVLRDILQQFLPDFKLKFELYFGWDKGADLRGQLAQNLEKERGLGYTLYGCHRADLKIKNHNLAAGATLSRGQLKMLVYAMRLAQGILLKQQTQRSCIYLIDDLNSELDDNSQCRLLNTLLECQHQVFISNIQSDFRNILIPHGRTDIKVFNLERGRLVD